MSEEGTSPVDPVEEESNTAIAQRSRRSRFGFGRRRHFLVDRHRQVRAIALVAGAVLIPLVFLNILFWEVRHLSSQALMETDPELAREVRAEDRTQLFFVGLGSFFLAGTAILVSLFETHKTAGALFAIRKAVKSFEQGNYKVVLHLRKEDKMGGTEETINELFRALERKTSEEMEVLADLADRVEKAGARAEALELRSMVEQRKGYLQL